jgi:hypothetical protein
LSSDSQTSCPVEGERNGVDPQNLEEFIRIWVRSGTMHPGGIFALIPEGEARTLVSVRGAFDL